jgi:hypothetical protein
MATTDRKKNKGKMIERKDRQNESRRRQMTDQGQC